MLRASVSFGWCGNASRTACRSVDMLGMSLGLWVCEGRRACEVFVMLMKEERSTARHI